MTYGGILTATITLIILLLFFKRISLTLCKKGGFSLIIDTGLLTLTLSDFNKSKKKKTDFSAYIPAIRYLIKGSKLYVERLVLSDLSTFGEKKVQGISLYIAASSLIPLLLSEARKTVFSDSAYLVDVCEEEAPEIVLEFDFFLSRLVISLLFVAYYKIKYALNGRYRNAG